ncbi:MAG: MFS transporter, partial [Nocardioidaceae bacterium]
LLPWLGMLRREVYLSGGQGRDRSAFAAVARSPMAWAMALFFGVQASNAYVQLGWLAPMYIDAGMSPAYAGVMVSIIQALGIPIALALPQVTRMLPDAMHVLLPIVFSVLCVAGWLGVMAAADAAPWLWAAMLGVGGASFPWMLSMIGLRSGSTRGAAALSGFVQPVGYLIAAIGPFAVGLMHDATGSWRLPLLSLAVASCLMLVGVVFARPPRPA